MTARDWIYLAVAVVTLASAWGGFLLRRLLKSVDMHGDAIAELRAKLALYVLRQDHDVANAELAAHMEKLRIEAHDRETRIVNAIGSANDRQLDFLRDELKHLTGRIDRIKDSAPQPRR